MASTKGFLVNSRPEILISFLLRLEIILLEANLLTQVPDKNHQVINCTLRTPTNTKSIKVPICLGKVATLKEVTLR